MTRRPNFLFVITDQQRADHLGCAGNPLLRTPHLDALARAGTRFSRFHVATPICMPNRASIMTGRMPSLHGVRDNGTPLSLESTTFVELLRMAGWNTALIGKSHLQNYLGAPPLRPLPAPDGLVPPPYDLAEATHHRRIGPAYDMETTRRWRDEPTHEVATPFYGFDFARICTRHGDQVQGQYTRWLLAQRPDGDALRDPKDPIPDARYSAPQARRTRMPEALYPTSYIAGETIAWLERHAAQSAAAPFFLQCSFTDPH
ncbi:MAG: sulfatase-like hydrolase/transferase, partial [Variovorax sp.]